METKLISLRDFRVLLFGPLVGKYRDYGQSQPAFSFLESVGDMTGSQAGRDALRVLRIDPVALRALATRIYDESRGTGAGSREVGILGICVLCCPTLFSTCLSPCSSLSTLSFPLLL